MKNESDCPFCHIAEERTELAAATDRAKEEILKSHSPDGFNIGINVGKAAGQTIYHLHVHVIPRYVNDVPDPRGGVRHVIPEKGYYTPVPTTDISPNSSPPHSRPLITGESDPLLPHLLHHMASAHRADIAVAFILESGLAHVEEYFRDLLDRGGKLRILTGDYLGQRNRAPCGGCSTLRGAWSGGFLRPHALPNSQRWLWSIAVHSIRKSIFFTLRTRAV